ncbi:hypothetical protein KJ742_04000 [Patescibacteria group bacterium]|nr:hypothetical protein [Patescibacteria group bacterium]MBU1683084.1 hypothetical protein [Patescibacteria group bacterium]MBU1935155.1 hypothetical protein [Patescibacteria group bacterium]
MAKLEVNKASERIPNGFMSAISRSRILAMMVLMAPLLLAAGCKNKGVDPVVDAAEEDLRREGKDDTKYNCREVPYNPFSDDEQNKQEAEHFVECPGPDHTHYYGINLGDYNGDGDVEGLIVNEGVDSER